MDTIRAIFALAFKDLKLLARDRANAFFTFLFPLLLAVFFGWIFGGGGGGSAAIKIAVVNQGGAAGEAFIADLRADAGLRVIDAATAAEAEDTVRKGNATAALIVPESFDPSMTAMFGGGGMEFELVVDPARNAEAGLLEGKLTEHAFRRMSSAITDREQMRSVIRDGQRQIAGANDLDAASKLLFGTLFRTMDQLNEAGTLVPEADAVEGEATADNGADAAPAWRPVTVTRRAPKVSDEKKQLPRSSFEISFPQGIVWGLMGVVTAFGTSVAEERTRGTLMRLTCAPIRRWHVLTGKAVACFIAAMVMQAILLAFGMAFFPVRVEHPGMMLFAMLACAIGFTGVMMALAGLSRTEAGAAGMGRAIVLILAMIGGGTIPIFFMPEFLQIASSISPFRWATLAVEGALWRGFSFEEMLLPVGVLMGFAAAGFGIGAVSLRWSTQT